MANGFFERRMPTGEPLNTERVYEDTGTEKSYGELTWSNKQILCDTLQNSLDAETRKFISQIEAASVVNVEENLTKATDNLEWKSSYLDMLNLLYVLSYRAGDLDETEKDTLVEKIHEKARRLGVELRNVDVEHFENSERPDLPQLTYAVRDTKTGKVVRALSRDDLMAIPYTDSGRYTLFEWSVSDAGSGYDVTKSVLYLPTKTNERFSRGVFGEGLKVNQAAIARVPGVTLRIHSQYEEEGGNPVAWVRHVQSEGDMVVQRGRNVRRKVAPSTGSGTTIRFVQNQAENEELQEVLDPRVTSMESIAAEFGGKDFTYPLGIQDGGTAYPGVSLHGTSDQYLQGLSIGTPNEPLLFSYDFHNRNVIAGRDRNHLNRTVMQKEVVQFWEHVHSPALYRELLNRLLFARSSNNTPERSVLFNACKRYLESAATVRDEMLLQEFVQSLGLRNDVPNYIASYADGMVSHIDPKIINVVQLQLSCTENEANLIRETLAQNNPEFNFLKLPKETPEISSKKGEKDERAFTDKERIFTEKFSWLFIDVKTDCEYATGVLQGLGWRTQVDSNIRYQVDKWRSEVCFRVEATNDSRIITCLLPGDGSDPDKTPDLTDKNTLIRVTAEVQVLYLASLMLGKGSFYSTERAYGEYAQLTAQELLDESMGSSPDFSDSLSTVHEKADALMREQFKGIRLHKEREGLEDMVVNFEKEVSRLSCPPERLLEIGRWCVGGHLAVRGARDLRDAVLERIVVEGQHAIFVEKDAIGELVLRQIELNETNKIGEWSGYPAYRVSEDRIVIPVPTHEKATLAKQEGSSGARTYAICGDSVVYINTDNSSVDNASSGYPYRALDKDCIRFSDIENLEEYVYSPVPQVREPEDMLIETGLMKSPITLEYISAHWSDPERIFQDLGQNHMDAGGFEERYLVLRDDKKVWVNKDDLGDSQILGYELSDSGLGYSPSGIPNMGHTRKRNPFLTGKNGEGLKLAAASAKKNGFDITFASFGENDRGERVAWRADVLTIDEPYTHDGKTNYAKRLGFQVTTQPMEILGDRSAVTRLELSNDTDATSSERWNEWVECIDPRNKDSMGNGGIDRILITTEGSQGSYDTVGPVTVLYDRPGAIFENGMLIRTDSQDERTFTLGWNFPSITSTRERTHIDLEMAKAYIRYYFTHTTDERAVEHLLRSIQTHDIDARSISWSDDKFTKIVAVADSHLQKQDVDASWALPNMQDYPSQKLFQKVAKKLYPNKTLFSYEYAKRKGITMGGSMRHIREDERLNVSEEDYLRLRNIFPSMESYLEDISKSKINMDPESLSPLRNMVGGEIDRVAATINRIRRTPSSKPLLDYILQRSNTSMKELHSRLDALRPETSAGKKNDVFVMADDSNADGLASDGVGLRISLLDIRDRKSVGRLLGVLDHELSHKMLAANDYTYEFILLLFLLARDSLEGRHYPEPL